MTVNIQSSSDEVVTYVTEQLMAFNEAFLPQMTKQEELVPLHTHMCNEEGNIIAGINAYMVYQSTVKVEILWVDTRYRGKGYGSELLRYVENKATTFGAHMIHLDTFDFQARGFYEKCGYEVFATLEDSPAKGSKRFYMKKSLGQEGV